VLLPAQADSRSGSGVADAMPAARFVGTLAVPFRKSWNASKALTNVPLGAASAGFAGSPLPCQRTASSA
jgi:hypothetical protein